MGSPAYESTIDGMSGKLIRLPGKWMLTIESGPEPLDLSRLAELAERARRIKQSFFGVAGGSSSGTATSRCTFTALTAART